MEDSKHGSGMLVSKSLQLGGQKVCANTWIKTRPIKVGPSFMGQGLKAWLPVCHMGPHLQQGQIRLATSSRSATSVRSATSARLTTSSRSVTSDGPHLQQAQASPRRAQGGRTGRARVREGFSDQGLIWKAKISI
jgi:hypothetical protein